LVWINVTHFFDAPSGKTPQAESLCRKTDLVGLHATPHGGAFLGTRIFYPASPLMQAFF
jgi:hypothetical protein